MDQTTADIRDGVKFCGACGASVEAANRFCQSCGKTLSMSASDQSKPPPPAAVANSPGREGLSPVLILAIVLAVCVPLGLFGLDYLSSHSLLTSVPDVQTQATALGENIKAQVASDAARQYAIIPSSDLMSRCVHAGFVTEAYLQAQDQDSYTQWHMTQAVDCSKAHLPYS